MSEFVVMENVKKTYKMGEVMIHAVDGVDIEIHKGEFAVIVDRAVPVKRRYLICWAVWTA